MHNLDLLGREGKLSINPYPLLNLSKYIEELKAYPYGCAEQTTRIIYPSLFAIKDLLVKFHIINNYTDQQRHVAINEGISHLLTMQRSNGSFGLWTSDSSEEWLTVYVTDFFVQARDRGYMIPEYAMQNALVVDFLPAGLELENQDLLNTSVNLENVGKTVKKIA